MVRQVYPTKRIHIPKKNMSANFVFSSSCLRKFFFQEETKDIFRFPTLVFAVHFGRTNSKRKRKGYYLDQLSSTFCLSSFPWSFLLLALGNMRVFFGLQLRFLGGSQKTAGNLRVASHPGKSKYQFPESSGKSRDENCILQLPWVFQLRDAKKFIQKFIMFMPLGSILYCFLLQLERTGGWGGACLDYNYRCG